jgi:hypothetical protein
VHIWGIHLKNKQIIFNVDNQAVVAVKQDLTRVITLLDFEGFLLIIATTA